jgi:hypothetical protein
LSPRRLTSATSPHPTRPPVTATSNTGNRGFAESNILRRELNLMLSAKNFSLRAKKKKTLGEEFFAESIFFALCEEFFLKNYFFTFNFLSTTCTYTKDLFKFDTILSLFAIFKIFTSF